MRRAAYLLLLLPFAGTLSVPLYNYARADALRHSVLLLVSARVGSFDRSIARVFPRIDARARCLAPQLSSPWPYSASRPSDFWPHAGEAPNMASLEEWALGGRSFGTIVSWFLLGGDLYTAYTFIAVPALVYGVGRWDSSRFRMRRSPIQSRWSFWCDFGASPAVTDT